MTETTPPNDEFASPETRMAAYYALFLRNKERLIPVKYRDYVGIDKMQLLRAVEMYLDYRKRVKTENSLPMLHRSKVAAHMVKWILHFRPIYTTLDDEEWSSLSPAMHNVMANLNYTYAAQIIFHSLDELDPADFQPKGKYGRVFGDLLLNMRRGTYEAHMAEVLFSALAVNY